MLVTYKHAAICHKRRKMCVSTWWHRTKKLISFVWLTLCGRRMCLTAMTRMHSHSQVTVCFTIKMLQRWETMCEIYLSIYDTIKLKLITCVFIYYLILCFYLWIHRLVRQPFCKLREIFVKLCPFLLIVFQISDQQPSKIYSTHAKTSQMQVSLSVNNILLFFWTHLLIKVKSPELSVWEQKISEKKDENVKGLCHILLLLPHPVRGQQRRAVSRSDWSSGCNNSADWLKDCRSWAPILNINTRSSSLFFSEIGSCQSGSTLCYSSLTETTMWL